MDDDKSIQEKKAIEYVKNPKMMSELIKSMARNPPIMSENGLVLKYEDLENGDFMIVDKEKLII